MHRKWQRWFAQHHVDTVARIIQPMPIAALVHQPNASSLPGQANSTIISWMKVNRIDQYDVLECLGTGATGSAFRAIDTRNQQAVAIKLLSFDAARQENIQRPFVREMTAISKLNHENVVRVLNSGVHDEQFYCVMEPVDFGTVKKSLQERGKFSSEEAVRCAIQICDPLQHAHDLEIVHRDLKPANLFLSAGGLVKLGDFGLARDKNEITITDEGQMVGTCLYMAPEQIAGNKNNITGQVDLYALGCVLHEMRTGRVPFSGDTLMEVIQQHYRAPSPDLRDGDRNSPAELAELIQPLLAKQPVDRLQNAATARGRLVRIIKKHQADGRHVRADGRRRLLMAAVVVALVVAAIILLALMIRSSV